MADYSWVADIKKDAMAKKLQKRGMPNYRQLPISERYGVSFTGTQPDGTVDKSAPAGMEMAGSPHVYHQGEMKADTPEGSLYINADVTKMMNPPTVQDRNMMDLNQPSGNLPGFQTGGFSQQPSMLDAAKASAQGVASLAHSQSSLPGYSTGGATTPAVKTPSDIFGAGNKAASVGAAVAKTIAPINNATVVNTSSGANGMRDAALKNVDTAAKAVTNAMQPTVTTTAPVVTQGAGQKTITSATNTTSAPALAGQQQFNVQAPTIPAVAPTVPTAAQTAGSNSAGSTPLATKTNPLAGNPIALQGQVATNAQGLKDQQQLSANQQKLIQSGMDAGQAQTENQMLSNQLESNLNTTASQYGIAAGQYQDTHNANVQTYETNAINNGQTVDQVNAYLSSNGQPPLTQDQFMSMYNASPLGQADFTKQMNYAQTLLTAGGTANINAAAAIMNKQFPGTNIDFTNVLASDKSNTFSNGMANLAKYSAADMSPEAALTAMQSDGTLQMLGMTPVQAASMYNSIHVNALDKSYNDLVTSNMYLNSNETDRNALETVWKASNSGIIGYTVQAQFSVKDANGNLVQSFPTQSAADAYSKSNPGTMVTNDSTLILDAGNTANTVPSTAYQGKAAGDYFTYGNQTYQVGTDGKPVTPTVDVTNPFSTDNMKILGLGSKNNSYYTQIQNAQLDAIKKDPSIITPTMMKDIAALPPSDPIYQAVLKDKPVTPIQANSKMNGVRQGAGYFNEGDTIVVKLPDGTKAYAVAGKTALTGVANNTNPVPTGTFTTADGKVYNYHTYPTHITVDAADGSSHQEYSNEEWSA